MAASFAIDASCGSIRLGSSSVSDATQRTSSRTCAISVASSANLCEIAWNEPIGRPNWRRSLAYASASSKARWARPSDVAARIVRS